MEIGDRVKLTDRMAKCTNRGFAGMRRRHPVDWTLRRGTVWSGKTESVSVKWDDRRTLDQWPVKALEKIA